MDSTASGQVDVDVTGHETTQVVIVGSGFGALAAAKTLAKSKTPFVLISETTEHLFQPLLYQVATGVLSAGEIAPPIRTILCKYPNADVRLGRVVAVDAENRTVTYEAGGVRRRLGYRSLIAATGATQAYFGHDEFEAVTFKLKTVEDAEALRRQILRCFEEAHTTTDAQVRHNLVSFAVVGAGATGVELAGQIKELARRYFAYSINNVTAEDVTVTLVEGAGVTLPAFGGKLSKYTQESLEGSGVEVLLNTMVTAIDEHGVVISSKTEGDKRINAETVIWSAGVQANDFAAVLGKATGCETDRAGRLLVNPDLTVGGYATVFAVGDMTSLDGLPGQSPVAMQGGRHAAKLVNGKRQAGTAFAYRDKGSMAIINRFSAVARVGKKIEVKGTIAWFMWLAVHLMYLVGFRNRYIAVMSWFSSFIGHRRPHFYYAQEPIPVVVKVPAEDRPVEYAVSA